MNAPRISLIVGLVLAFGTGLLMLNYLSSVHAATDTGQRRTILVAVQDIPARATIDARMVGTAQRPAAQVDSDAIDRPGIAVGAMTLITIPRGSEVTKSKIARVSALALPRRLAHGLRAVSISIDKVKGVSGLIQPGDRVDVIAVPPRVANETPQARTILRGALVVAMGGETESARATPAPDSQTLTTVTLAVTPKQADLLALADVNTTLRLALRPPEEPIRAFAAEPLQLGVAPTPAPAAPEPQPAPPAQRPMVAQAPVHRDKQRGAESGVQLIDGDRVVDQTGERR